MVDKVKVVNQGPKGLIFLLAYLGAAVYFVQQSEGFFGFIWAILKAVVWPAILVFNGLEAFNV